MEVTERREDRESLEPRDLQASPGLEVSPVSMVAPDHSDLKE